MTDASYRDAQRAVAENPEDADAQAHYLRQRARAGEITLETLHLLELLSLGTSSRMTMEELHGPSPLRLHELAERLTKDYPEETCIRAGLAVAWSMLATMDRDRNGAEFRGAVHLLSILERCVVTGERTPGTDYNWRRVVPDWVRCLYSVKGLMRARGADPMHYAERPGLVVAFESVHHPLTNDGAIQRHRAWVARQAIKRELIPALLGERDVVAERVKERQVDPGGQIRRTLTLVRRIAALEEKANDE